MPNSQPLAIKTTDKKRIVDITDQFQGVTGKEARAVVVYVQHTTCAVTTADLDPGHVPATICL